MEHQQFVDGVDPAVAAALRSEVENGLDTCLDRVGEVGRDMEEQMSRLRDMGLDIMSGERATVMPHAAASVATLREKMNALDKCVEGTKKSQEKLLADFKTSMGLLTEWAWNKSIDSMASAWSEMPSETRLHLAKWLLCEFGDLDMIRGMSEEHRGLLLSEEAELRSGRLEKENLSLERRLVTDRIAHEDALADARNRLCSAEAKLQSKEEELSRATRMISRLEEQLKQEKNLRRSQVGSQSEEANALRSVGREEELRRAEEPARLGPAAVDVAGSRGGGVSGVNDGNQRLVTSVPPIRPQKRPRDPSLLVAYEESMAALISDYRKRGKYEALAQLGQPVPEAPRDSYTDDGMA